jgi:hypothetical protein
MVVVVNGALGQQRVLDGHEGVDAAVRFERDGDDARPLRIGARSSNST